MPTTEFLNETPALFEYESATTAESEIREAADTILVLSGYAIQLAEIERVPRYNPDRRENDSEHSFMLALVASELAARYRPWLDSGLVTQFSIVHELAELVTGDIPTFQLDQAALAQKQIDDHDATQELLGKLPVHIGSLLLRYETQIEPEARFVRLIDKILPVAVDILGPGSQVMVEDYGVRDTAALDAAELKLSRRIRDGFPDKELTMLHLIRDVLAERFARHFNPNLAASQSN